MEHLKSQIWKGPMRSSSPPPYHTTELHGWSTLSFSFSHGIKALMAPSSALLPQPQIPAFKTMRCHQHLCVYFLLCFLVARATFGSVFISKRSQPVPCMEPFSLPARIYDPINGESLCVIKRRADLSAIQFHNYWSNLIIFRYVALASVDLEDLPVVFNSAIMAQQHLWSS